MTQHHTPGGCPAHAGLQAGGAVPAGRPAPRPPPRVTSTESTARVSCTLACRLHQRADPRLHKDVQLGCGGEAGAVLVVLIPHQLRGEGQGIGRRTGRAAWESSWLAAHRPGAYGRHFPAAASDAALPAMRAAPTAGAASQCSIIVQRKCTRARPSIHHLASPRLPAQQAALTTTSSSSSTSTHTDGSEGSRYLTWGLCARRVRQPGVRQGVNTSRQKPPVQSAKQRQGPDVGTVV